MIPLKKTVAVQTFTKPTEENIKGLFGSLPQRKDTDLGGLGLTWKQKRSIIIKRRHCVRLDGPWPDIGENMWDHAIIVCHYETGLVYTYGVLGDGSVHS